MFHAEMSSSGSPRWMRCPGSVVLSAGVPDTGSSYADEGTAAHHLAALVLEFNKPARNYRGDVIALWIDAEGAERATMREYVPSGVEPSALFTVDDEMADAVQTYADTVRSVAKGAPIMIEQRLPIGHLTGEAGAFGTGDAVVIVGDELHIHDLKYGKGERVVAANNSQLRMYALGALEQFGIAQEFQTVRTFIHQPRLGACSEEAIAVAQLHKWAEVVAQAAAVVRDAKSAARSGEPIDGFLVPSTEACRWCRVKATCPALAKRVEETVGAAFDVINDSSSTAGADAVVVAAKSADDDALAAKMAACDLIEDWIKAVRAEVERRLFAGVDVPGYKLVQGRAGARAWTDAKEAERVLREQFRLKIEEAYDLKLISPTSAEKLAKAGTIGPRQWVSLQSLIHRPEGKPSVAPASDARPALNPQQSTAEAFGNLGEFADIA